MGIERPALGSVTFREGFAFKALAVIKILDQRTFRACSAAVDALVMLPEHQGIDGPCIVNVFVQTLAYGGWELVEGFPIVSLKALPDFMSDRTIIEWLWVRLCSDLCGHMLFLGDETTRYIYVIT